MKKTLPMAIGLAVLALAVAHPAGSTHAQSSLGIGTSDAMGQSTGLFAHQLLWINQKQQEFYRDLANAMKAMRQDGAKLWLLIGLSFLYGIFHAAGPGHGKAVISSYMVANDVALRRGILLSFLSALLQSLTAVIVMLLAYLVLRGTSISMTDAAEFLETCSFVFVAAFGAWLLWKKAGPPLVRLFGGRYTDGVAITGSGRGHARHCTHTHHIRLRHEHAQGSTHSRQHGKDDVCPTCGHNHAPDPALLAGERFDWRSAWAAVAAVGIRPCTGALIVLSFALLNGLWMGGILSVLAMGFGTAVTVSVLATVAVTAKDWAVLLAGEGRLGNRIHSAIEIAGAAFVFLLGLLLLSARLSA
jgi:ABC-type nickel/cobalt efflux system permease component RcnA